MIHSDMLFAAQIVLLALAAIFFALVVEKVLPPSVFEAMARVLKFNLPPAGSAASCRTSTLAGNEGDAPTGAAGDQFTTREITQ